MMLARNRCRGFTLIEIAVGGTISVLLAGLVARATIGFFRGAHLVMARAELASEANLAVAYLADDLRGATSLAFTRTGEDSRLDILTNEGSIVSYRCDASTQTLIRQAEGIASHVSRIWTTAAKWAPGGSWQVLPPPPPLTTGYDVVLTLTMLDVDEVRNRDLVAPLPLVRHVHVLGMLPTRAISP